MAGSISVWSYQERLHITMSKGLASGAVCITCQGHASGRYGRYAKPATPNRKAARRQKGFVTQLAGATVKSN